MEVVLTFTPHTSSVSSGDMSEAAGKGVVIRGDFKQLTGYKKMMYAELISEYVYEFRCYDNTVLTSTATSVYGGMTLNIREIIRNHDESFTNEVRIILVAK